MLSTEEYTTIAKKIIAKQCKYLLRDEEAIGEVVTGLMLADWKFKEGYNRTRERYRYESAKWSILKLIRTRSKYNNTEIPENVYEDTSENLYDDVEYVRHLLDTTLLSHNERKFIDLHFLQGQSIKDISIKTNMSKEGIRNNINRALKRIRSQNDIS